MQAAVVPLVIFIAVGLCAAVPARTKRATRCYAHDPEVGCFSNEFPFNNTDGALPLVQTFVQTKFHLFTRENTRHPAELVRHDRLRLRRSGFNPELNTKVIVHGFMQNGDVEWLKDMALALLRKERCNVILTNWGFGAGWPYTQAVANTRLVGAEMAALIWFLNNATGSTNERFHIIGHSLGAHVAGYAGQRLPGLGRITGLDPAEPNFKNTDIRVRLDPTDAQLVDVIHTDGSEFDTISGYGMMAPCGHIDFYPNGGEYQPGCPQETWSNVVSEVDHGYGYERVGDELSCSHSRSIMLFTESIDSTCQFLAFPCRDYQDFLQGNCFSCGNNPCPTMGYSASAARTRGKHYLATAQNPPYCGYHYQTSIEFGAHMSPERGTIEVVLFGTNGLQERFEINTDKQAFMANQARDAMFVSHVNLGDVQRVQVKFLHQGNWFYHWIWGNQVDIRSISVTRGQSERSWTFCGDHRSVQSGETRIFSSSPADHSRNCHPPHTPMVHHLA